MIMEANNEMSPKANPTKVNQAKLHEKQPRMTFKEAVSACMSKYATLSGRARRSEYWWFSLFILLLTSFPVIALSIVNLVQGGSLTVDPEKLSSTPDVVVTIFEVMLALVCLLFLLPSIAVQVRRLHDTGRSGWWLVWSLLSRIPYEITSVFVLGGSYAESRNVITNLVHGFQASPVGGSLLLLFSLLSWGMSIVILVFMLQDSDKGENRFGPSPKYQ